MMAKKVVIDGVEYVPKEEVSPPKIIGFSVDYDDMCGGFSKRYYKYPIGATFEIVGINGEQSSVYLTGKYAEELLEAIHK